jgi:2-methylcitrate dehydratase PrpD
VYSPAAGVELILSPLERKRRPQTPYEGKFSAPFAIGALLTGGSVDVATFTQARLADPEILRLGDKVDYEVWDYDTFPAALPGGVAVMLEDGERLERHLPHQRGGAENPMTPAEIVAKFRTNAAFALGAEDALVLERFALSLDRQPDLAATGLLATAGPRS